MSNFSGVSAYRTVGAGTGVEEASRERLVQMLFDGALARIAAARGHIQRAETAAKGEQLGKAISIVEGLRGSLDPQAGPLSENLGDLYAYIVQRLLVANLHDDESALDEVAGLLREVKSAWDVLVAEAGPDTREPA